MAASKLATGAQIPTQCNLCEINLNIKFKCLDCDILICRECKDRVHPESEKRTNGHRIIDIKDIGERSELSINTNYQTTFSLIDFMDVSLDGCLWIGETINIFRHSTSGGRLQKVRLEEGNINIISSFNVNVTDISITPSNDLLAVLDLNDWESTVKIMKKDSNELSDSIYRVAGVKVYRVHATRCDHVILGGYDWRHERGVLFLMDKHGKILDKYERDQNGRDMFPLGTTDEIACTSMLSIFVVYRILCKVQILGGGGILNIYKGNPSLTNQGQLFRPADVKVTSSDNAVISDCNTHAHTLHVLNGTGNLLKLIDTKSIGIERPGSLAITTDGHFDILYIESNKSLKAKIYKVLFTGF